MFKTIYHVTNGPAVMYEIDARHALANHSGEWFKTQEEAEGAGPTAKGGVEDEKTRKEK
jgi:hypothetical protein